MSETMTCPFCGKELTKGSFGMGKNTRKLSIWLIDLICCPECHQKYKEFAAKDGNRFYTKLENTIYIRHIDFDVTNYFTQEEIAELFSQYYEESKQYRLDREYCKLFVATPGTLEVVNGAVLTDEVGLIEASLPSTLAGLSADRMEEENRRNEECYNRLGAVIPNKAWPFKPEDFTCFEYAFGEQENVGEQVAVRFFVKLNNIRRMTYKPCLIQGVVVYPNYMLTSYIEEFVEGFMIELRSQLGIEHLPIVRKTEAQLQDKVERRADRITPLNTWEKVKKKAEQVWDKIVDIYEAFQEKIRIVRIIASFTALASTVAGILVYFVPDASYTVIGLFGLIGMVSVLLACPLHMLGIIWECIVFCFNGGILFGLLGFVATLFIAMFVILYLPAVITIPYCFKELME